MPYLITNKKHLTDLLNAARKIPALMEDGTIGAAFTNGTPDQTHATVSAFDTLDACAALVVDSIKNTSPFLRYRREILGHYDTAKRLRALVLNLRGGSPANLSQLFMGADEHHTRVALELIASYSQYGENDTFFMGLPSEIADAELMVGEAA